MVWNPRSKIVEKKFGLKPEKFWKRYSKYDKVERRKKHIKTYSDVGIIKNLVKNYKLGIVTGANRKIANLEIGLIGKDLFESIIITSGDMNSKPDPEGLQRCLGELNTKNKSAVFIGNGYEDFLAAKNAGITYIRIDRDEHNFDFKPEIMIKQLEELKQEFKLEI